MLNQCPAVVIHTVAFVHQQLAEVPGTHVRGDFHYFSRAIFAKDFDDLHSPQ
uniref:Uncharacterized protein n=1 Tax=Anguilla anguilla TaxID=7936 RepID=A0A0E9S831_ANGAN